MQFRVVHFILKEYLVRKLRKMVLLPKTTQMSRCREIYLSIDLYVRVTICMYALLLLSM